MKESDKLDTIINFIDNETLIRALYKAVEDKPEARIWLETEWNMYAEENNDGLELDKY